MKGVMEVEKELKGERGRIDGDRTRRRKEKVRASPMRKSGRSRSRNGRGDKVDRKCKAKGREREGTEVRGNGVITDGISAFAIFSGWVLCRVIWPIVDRDH